MFENLLIRLPHPYYLYMLNALKRIKHKINLKVYFPSQVQEASYLELTKISF